MHELERRWHAFLERFRAGDDARSLPALQQWIEEWDRCFWAADFGAFDAIYAPDFRAVNHMRFPTLDDVRGPQGFQRLREEVAEAASHFRFDIREIQRGCGGRFAGLGRFRARGRYTGLVLQAPFAVVWTLRGDRIVLADAFMSHRDARAHAARDGG